MKIDIEKIDNELKDFNNNKIKSNKNTNNKESYSSKPEIISINTIKEYIAKIKQLNPENLKIEKELEDDIINQVNNYNEES